jgi:hypothetical protein
MVAEAAEGRPSSDTLLLTHAVLVGLTRFLPVPFLDDVLRDALLRRMVDGIARRHDQVLPPDELAAVSGVDEGGLLRSATRAAMRAPLRWLSRKLVFFLAWKQSVDLVSRAYHLGWLVERAFERGSLPAGDPARAAEVRAAIDGACHDVPVTPVERAFREALSGSQHAFRRGATLLARAWRRVPRAERGAERAAVLVEEAVRREDAQMRGVMDRLQAALRSLPDSHFARLSSALDARLRDANGPPGGTRARTSRRGVSSRQLR